MSNFKTRAARLGAVFGCALTLGLGVLAAAAPAQARAVTTPDTHPAATSAHLLGGSFKAIPAASGTFEIINYVTGYCLGMQGGSSAVGTLAVVWNCNGNPDQQWHVKATNAEGFQQFENNSGLCLGVQGGSTAEGANLVGYTCYGTSHPDQYWASLDSEASGGPSCSGYEPFGNYADATGSGWVVGTQGGTSAEGDHLVQWNWQKACNNQYWSL